MSYFNVNENVIVRVASLNKNTYNQISKMSSFFNSFLENESLKKQYEILKKELDEDLFYIVKNTDENKMNILNLKRRIYKNKYINKEVNFIPSTLKNKIDMYNKYNELVYNNKIKRIEIDNDQFLSLYKIFIQNYKTLKPALEISSPTFLREIEKLKNYNKDLPNKKTTNLSITLFKFLTRAIFKTSPFSTFCLQGIGVFGNFNKIDLSSTNLRMVSYKSLVSELKNKNVFDHIYQVNEHIWINKDYIKILKKITNDLGRNLILHNKNQIVKIEKDPAIIKFITNYRGLYFSALEIIEILINEFNFSDSDAENNFNLLIELGILEFTYIQELDVHLNKLPSFKYPASSSDLKQDVYQDVFIKDKIYLKGKLNDDCLKTITKLTYLMDLSNDYRTRFIEFIGKSTIINMEEIIDRVVSFHENSLSTVYTTEEKKWLLNDYRQHIKKNKDKYCISSKWINKQFEKKIDRSPISATFFFQLFEGVMVLNKIYSGFGRMHSKFFYRDDVKANTICLLKKLESEIRVELVDIVGIYGFNSNLHEKITNNVVDAENSSGIGRSLKELRMEVDYESKKINFLLNDKKVMPVNLLAMTTKHMPLIHKFICQITHFDTINLDLNLIAFNKNLLGDKKIIMLPRVYIDKDVIISRKKWVINLEKINGKGEINFCENLIVLFQQNKVPIKFFVRPLEATTVDNLSQINDYFKPQFIDMSADVSLKLLYKISRKCSLLIIEEVLPNKDTLKKHTFELGVETYLT